MELWRFLIGLALLSLASVASISATDSSFAISDEAIARNIGLAVGEAFGGVMLIGIFIWTPLRWFRGAEKVPDFRRFTLCGTAIFVLLFSVFRFFGTPLSESERLPPPVPLVQGKNRYLAMVEDTIARQWVAPPLLTSTPLVILKFRISRSGEISRIHIAESSGHAHYDSAAQRAVQTMNPLPPFPSDISDPFFDVKYRFIKD